MWTSSVNSGLGTASPSSVTTGSYSCGVKRVMKRKVTTFWSNDSGQSIAEYALIIALVAVGLVLVLIAFRDEIGRVFNTIRGEMETRGSPSQLQGD